MIIDDILPRCREVASHTSPLFALATTLAQTPPDELLRIAMSESAIANALARLGALAKEEEEEEDGSRKEKSKVRR